jgi:hypothetical protein
MKAGNLDVSAAFRFSCHEPFQNSCGFVCTKPKKEWHLTLPLLHEFSEVA